MDGNLTMASETSLDTLRQQIDQIDEALHDLLMKRSEVVERIGAINSPDSIAALHPWREAELLRRVISRHRGHLPKANLVRIWREVIGSMLGLQGNFSVAVYMPERGSGYLELARDHYGAYTPMTALRTPGQVARAVAEGSATVGIMPMPDRENVEPWWISLMGDSADLPRIITRLPFAGPGPGRGDGIEALAIGRFSPSPSGFDRSWMAIETPPDVSRARLRSVLDSAGIETVTLTATQRSDDNWLHLVEASGHLAANDPRVARLTDGKEPVLRCALLGGYPVPFGPEDLA